MTSTRKTGRLVISVALASTLMLGGCTGNSGETTKNTNASATQSAEADSSVTFPLDFKNADGTVTKIKSQPKRIVSTSVTITGMALTFKPPIIASATAANSKFFPAWAKNADELHVQPLWAAGTPANLEAVTAAKPDLIIVSVSGHDSVKKQLADLQKIAPVISIDYSKDSWQQVTKKLGEATGMSKAANTVVENFNNQVKTVAAKLKLPEGKTNIISYNGPGKKQAIAHPEGPYGELFTALGFNVETPDPSWSGGSEQGASSRKDFAFTSLENLTKLTGNTTFLIKADDETAQHFMSEPVLANLPSVRSKQVFSLGKEVFRLDYYTSQLVLKAVEKAFGK